MDRVDARLKRPLLAAAGSALHHLHPAGSAPIDADVYQQLRSSGIFQMMDVSTDEVHWLLQQLEWTCMEGRACVHCLWDRPKQAPQSNAHSPTPALLLPPVSPSPLLAVCRRELHAPQLHGRGITGLEAARLAVHPWSYDCANVLQAEHSLELHLPYISYVMR